MVNATIRRAALALIITVVGIGCADSAASQAQKESPPEGPESILEPAGGSHIPDGLYMARIAELGGSTVTVNFLGWYTGSAAEREAAARHETVPNDFLLVDEVPEQQTLPLGDELAVTSVWADWESTHEVAEVEIDLPTLRGYFSSPEAFPARHIVLDPFRLRIDEGQVTRLDEQYIP
jgi:hypothetical protein